MIKMQEQKEKKVRKKRIKGIGGVLEKTIDPLRTSLLFKELYGDLKLKLLLNAIDSKYAAILTFNEGEISIEAMSNEDKKALKKKVIGYDGMLATSTPLFLQIAMGQLSMGAMAKKVVARKIKIKGAKNLLKLQNIFALLQKDE